MNLTLYHGSQRRIERPIYGFGNAANDYGMGFYCTESLDLACEWAVDAARDGFANEYHIDTEGLDILNLKSPEYSELQWLAILLQNRTFDTASILASDARDYLLENFLPDYQERDIIVGYRADDSYFAFAQDFISGGISLRQLGNAMRFGELGLQVVLKSEKAFERLAFVGARSASCEKWLASKTERDLSARRAYLDKERHRRQKGDLYITQILDEQMGPDDARLR